MKYPFLFTVIVFRVFLIQGQQSDYLFEHLTIDDGLSNNAVSSIVRDHLGFIWFATNEGLTRYDGYGFTVYQHIRDNPNSLSNNKVYSVFEDSKKNLWIGTRMGLNLYNREFDNFTRFVHNPADDHSLSNNLIRYIYEDNAANLWLATLGGGLNRFDEENKRFVRYNFPDRNVWAVLHDSQKNLWVGTGATGIYLLDWENNAFTHYDFPQQTRRGLKPVTGKTLYEDTKGNLWVCTEGAGLYRFDLERREFVEHFYANKSNHGINSNIVSDIFQYDKENYWIATDGGGINIYNEATGIFRYVQNNITDIKSLSSNAIYSFLRDEDGVIWIGTFGGGISILNPHRQVFRFYTQRAMERFSLNHKSVLSFHEDVSGRIWVGTDGGGLNLFDPKNHTFKSYSHDASDIYSISSNVVTSIQEDSRGNLWIGTFAGGLNRFDHRTGRFHRYQYNPADPHSINSNNIWTLLEDSDHNLWVGSLDGLEFYSYEKNAFSKIPATEHNGRPFPGRILSLLQDSRGNIWVGSTGTAILNKFTREYDFPEIFYELQDYDIRDLYEDRHGNIWIASEGAGLFMYNPVTSRFERYTTRNGLPSDAIHQIIQDNREIFWLSTSKGISRFDPIRQTFHNYNVSDGLQSNQFAYSASLYSKSGEIWFGGINGFNVFHPDFIKENRRAPKVYITDFLISNKPVEIGENSLLQKHIMLTREIRLPYQAVFTFRFTAINYISTAKNRYRYKLEGFDDWNDVGDQRMATYTNINPGKYVFRVIASNNDGVWNEEGASIAITILPPFWRTWIAYLFYIVAFGVLFYFILRFVINRQKYRHDLMIKDLEKSKIEEINQVKLRFFTDIAHEFRTPLTLILGPLDKIMTAQESIDPALRKQLHIMGRNAGRLLRLINELMEFRKIERGKVKLKVVKADLVSFLYDVKSVFDEHACTHDINFTFTSSVEVLEAWFDKEKMEKVIYNLLSNSFKFTPDWGSVNIEVSLVQKKIAGQEKGKAVDHARFTITDNGVGISPEELPRIFERFYQVKNQKSPSVSSGISGTGIGLALSKELIEFHRGDIIASSEPGKGSTFEVSFPVDKIHFNQGDCV
jgi:signal transduction histidine kinase/ligand-binding sensor domain-containing protein